jgi:hypothetical protein
MVMASGLDGLRLIPEKRKSLFSEAFRQPLEPILSTFQSVGVKTPEREADHSPVGNIEMKNSGA